MATETISCQEIAEELRAIRKSLDYLQTHMFDPDTIMTIEEEKRFKQALREYEQGKTTSLEEFKKELGL